MSGLIGHQGSKSGRIGLFSGQWKLLHTIDMSSDAGEAAFGGTHQYSFYVGKGMQKGTFLRYRIDLSSPRQAATTSGQELFLRWSTVEGRPDGYGSDAGQQGYYGVMSGHHRNNSAFTFNTEVNDHKHRICYMDNPDNDENLAYCTVEMDNHGVSRPGGGNSNLTYSARCTSVGKVSAGTDVSIGGGCTSFASNNNAGNTGSEGSGGEITAMSIGATNAFEKGFMRLYGLCN